MNGTDPGESVRQPKQPWQSPVVSDAPIAIVTGDGDTPGGPEGEPFDNGEGGPSGVFNGS